MGKVMESCRVVIHGGFSELLLIADGRRDQAIY
jgi:hypothetical protein